MLKDFRFCGGYFNISFCFFYAPVVSLFSPCGNSFFSFYSSFYAPARAGRSRNLVNLVNYLVYDSRRLPQWHHSLLASLVNYLVYDSDLIPYTHVKSLRLSATRKAHPPAGGGIIYKIYKISRAPSASRRKKRITSGEKEDSTRSKKASLIPLPKC